MQEFHGKIQAMQYTNKYSSPLGEMLMAADDTGLTGLWFMGQKYFALYLDREHKEKDLPVFRDTKHWLDIYFSGKEPNFKLPLHFTGSPFQNEVWKILYSKSIPPIVELKFFSSDSYIFLFLTFIEIKKVHILSNMYFLFAIIIIV